MSAPFELVVFSDDWFGLPFSCRHLVKHFLPEVPVTWVDTIGLRSPELTVYDLKRSVGKLAGWLRRPEPAAGPRQVPENLRLVDPIQIPYNHYGLVRRLNKGRLVSAAGPADRARAPRRVMLTTWPFLGNLIGALDEDLSVYYRVDDFSEFPGVRQGFIRAAEEDLMRRADLVVGTAEKLCDLSALGRQGRYLPHGVDYEHFASAQGAEACTLPIAQIPAPRIGFFGLLNSWVDLALVHAVATRHPEWSFVFIGSSQLPASALPVAPNLHFLGRVSYDGLPACARFFDVALIPFCVNPLTLAVNPLKLMEYFALGLPVVSTALPEVAKYGEHVSIAGDPDSFAAAISQALAGDDAARRESRQRLARSHSWEAKAAELRGWIEEALRTKTGAAR